MGKVRMTEENRMDAKHSGKKEIQKIFEIIQAYDMIRPGMRILAGVSGGADSVCLLYVLSRYREQVPFELMAVHVEHGIRGEESLADAEFTQELCRRQKVQCQVVQTPVQQIAGERGISVEEAGRQERYRIFEEVCSKWQGDRIAVAHNQNDQAETMLWNLVRGSGLKGLGGIRPVRGTVIRPLLFTSRTEIEQILTDAGISWRTDSTNLTEDYTRNRIRHTILPQMEQGLNTGAVQHIAEAAQKLQQVQAFLERMTEQAAGDALYQENDSVVLLLEPYQKTDKLLQMELLKRAVTMLQKERGLKDIGSVHLEMLRELTLQDCGKECHLPGKIRAVREAGILRLQKRTKTEQTEQKESRKAGSLDPKLYCELPVNGETQAAGWKIKTSLLANDPSMIQEILRENKYTKWLNYDIINSNVLLRTRQSGDYLIIDAAGGQKKVKDYFIDHKIPREKRDQILLLADGSHILWIVGYRISEAAKVTEETKRIFKIQMEESV